MRLLVLIGIIICIVIVCLRVLLKDRKERKNIFEKEELEKLNYENIVGEDTSYELYLYNRIRDKYTEVTINIAIEKQKVREKLGVYTNEKSDEYLSKVLLILGGLMGVLFTEFTDTKTGLWTIIIYVVVVIFITTIKDIKPMQRNKLKIKYYSMCLSVLEELELEKLNINKNKEV